MSPAALKRRTSTLLIGTELLFIAFFVRIWHLSAQSFWWDEAYSTMVASQSLRSIVSTLAREDFHPPLHYVILHFWMRIAGQSEFALRFVSVAAGVLTVAAAWAAARRLFTRTASPIAATVFALSPFLWYYSQETRMFALVPLFGTLALYFCARAIEDARRWPWIAYAAVVTLGLYDFYYAIFLPFVCGLWVLLITFRIADGSFASSRPPSIARTGKREAGSAFPFQVRWREKRESERAATVSFSRAPGEGSGMRETWAPWRPFGEWAVATFAAFLLYTPWLPIFLTRTGVWASAFTPDNGPMKVVVWSWPEFVMGLPNLALYQQTVPTALLGLAALATLGALAYAWWVKRRQPAAILAAMAFVVPFATIAAISAVKPVFHPRYAIPVVVGLYLALAGLVDYLLNAGPTTLILDVKQLTISGPRPHPSPLPRGEGTNSPLPISDGEGSGGEARSMALRARGPLGLALCALLAGCAIYGFYHLAFDPAYARDDYRDAIAYVERAEQPGDTILHNAIPPFWYYYHGPAPVSYFPNGPYTEANVAEELNQVTRGHPRLWYIQHAAIPNDPDGFVDTELRLHAKRLDERWFGAIRVQLWEIPPGTAFEAAKFTPLSANVANELTLLGYAVSGEAVGGRTVDVELQWQVRHTPTSDDGFWVAIEDVQGRSWGRADTRPRDAAYLLSSAWPVGETVVTRFDLPIDVGTPPNRYQIVAGVYRLNDLTGLDVLDANQHPVGQKIVLGLIEVSRPTIGRTDLSLPKQVAIPITPALTLAADQIGTTVLAPGDRLPVTLLWRADGALPTLHASLRLLAPSGQVIAQDDGPIGDTFPTDRWKAGELIREQRVLKLPASAPSGQATVSLVLSDGHSISLGSTTINRVVRDFTPPSTVHSLSAVFGDVISLVGYDLSSSRAKPGDQLIVTLDWKDVRTTSTSYHVFVHVLDAQNHIWAQWDGVPKNWTYPTSAWVPGEYVVDRYPLKLPSGTPAGDLTLEVGLYDATTGKRLPVVISPEKPADDRVVLQTIRVTR